MFGKNCVLGLTVLIFLNIEALEAMHFQGNLLCVCYQSD